MVAPWAAHDVYVAWTQVAGAQACFYEHGDSFRRGLIFGRTATARAWGFVSAADRGVPSLTATKANSGTRFP